MNAAPERFVVFLAVVGALWLLSLAVVIVGALFLGYRAHQVRRPYRDEHQGA